MKMVASTAATVAVACVAIFQAETQALDKAVYFSDGATTRKLIDLPDFWGTNAYFFTSVGEGRVLFSNVSEGAGRELWITNGTTAGTRLLKDISPGASPFSSNPGGSWNPSFSPGGGTTLSTRFQKVGNRLIFPATTYLQGREFWTSDGTAAGTRILADHRPGQGNGAGASSVTNPLVFSNGAFAIYTANDDTNRGAIWATDGTTAGRRLLLKYSPNVDRSYPAPFGFVGNRILFTIKRGTELWVTNGTAAGTKLLRQFSRSWSIDNISQLRGSRYALMAIATSAEGRELWITDGTAAGTKLLKNINLFNEDSNPGVSGYYKIGSKVYFTATDNPAGQELWVTQGTQASTKRVADLTPGTRGTKFVSFAVLGSRLYFVAATPESGYYVTRAFVTDGTAVGTRKLSTSLYVGAPMLSLYDRVVFPARPAGGRDQIWAAGPTLPAPAQTSNVDGGLRNGVGMQTVEVRSPNGVNAPCPQ
jgi:ELWxxDGT repeat protein